MECPNCKAHIGRFDLSQNCHSCGINLFYSQQETVLSRDAKMCELEFASFRLLKSRLQTAFIGGVIPILRFALSVLAVFTFLLPVASIKVSFPFFDYSFSIGALGLYQGFSNGGLMKLFDCLNVAATHGLALKALLVIVSLVVCALVLVVTIVISLFSILNMVKASKIASITSCVGVAAACVTAILSGVLVSSGAQFSSNIQISFSAGSIVIAAAFALLVVFNGLIAKKKIEPQFDEIDLRRVELRKKIKAGEVNIDDLPLPVFKTPEKEANNAEKVKAGEANG